MWEDPIVAEVRKARQEIFARFSYDLDAYFEHLGAVEAKERRRGVRYSDRPLARPLSAFLNEEDDLGERKRG
ncbi:MAG: hypothetical protein KY467_15975 [Gemmatimonadetes bacterium]|nr:hypothetical protein [Gemmatimonadota bacterium]